MLTVLYGVILAGERRILTGEHRGSGAIGNWILGTTSLHLLALVMRGVQVGACPVASQWDSLSLLAWCIAVLQILLVKFSGDRSTLIYSFSLVFLLQIGSASFTLRVSETSERIIDSLTSVHAFSALIGVAGVAIAGIHGALWMLLRNSIKNGRFGFLFKRLSSLEEIARLNRISTGIDATALTMTLLTSLFLNRTYSEFQQPDVVVTMILWGIFGCLTLFPRSTGSVIATRAWFSLLGFCGVVFIIGWIALFGFHAQ